MPRERVGTGNWKRRRRRPSPSLASSLLSLLPVLLLLLLLLGPTPATAFSASSTSGSSGNKPSTPSPPTPPLIDRVPTFRLYQRGVCQTQVSGRGDVAECRARLHEAITSLTKASSLPITTINTDGMGASSSPTSTRGRAAVVAIVDIDSLTALEGLLAEQQQKGQQETEASSPDSDEGLLVEFYGQSCKQCIALAPLFESLPFVYRDRRLRFGRADVTHFPTLVVPPPPPQVFHELDRSQDIEKRLEGCPRCGGGGFVPCGECEGKGHLIRSEDGHTVADVCMSCVGQKKVPCPQCGGKCYLC